MMVILATMIRARMSMIQQIRANIVVAIYRESLTNSLISKGWGRQPFGLRPHGSQSVVEIRKTTMVAIMAIGRGISNKSMSIWARWMTTRHCPSRSIENGMYLILDIASARIATGNFFGYTEQYNPANPTDNFTPLERNCTQLRHPLEAPV